MKKWERKIRRCQPEVQADIERSIEVSISSNKLVWKAVQFICLQKERRNLKSMAADTAKLLLKGENYPREVIKLAIADALAKSYIK